MIRLENNRADKVFLKEYLNEIESLVRSMQGLDDLNDYRLRFEKEFALLFGVNHAIAVNSGTDALQLALLTLGIGNGDSVIIPDLTYIATGLVVKYVGADPILIDVKKIDMTIDENKIEAAIRPNTKAIIAVHMFGNPCNLDKIRRIASKHKLFVIEDACQALGSTFKTVKVGTLSDIGAFSFSYYKPISSLLGNGGMVVFNNQIYKNRLSDFLDAWKLSPRLTSLDRKFNRMTLVDLATAHVKLRHIDKIIASKRRIRSLYERGLSGLSSIRFLKEKKDSFVINENFLIFAERRDKLFKYLGSKKVKSEMPYEPLHQFTSFSQKGKFPITTNYYKSGLHLPLYSFMLEKECLKVIELIESFYKK